MEKNNNVENSAYDFSRVAKIMLDAEKKLREIATDIQLNDLNERHLTELTQIQLEVSSLGEEKHPTLYNLTELYGRIYNVLKDAVYRVEKCLGANKSWKECYMAWYEKDTMEDLKKSVKKFTGKNCGFFSGDEEERITAYINDASNCIHILGETLAKSSFQKISSRCYSLLPNPELEEFCIEWEKTRELMSNEVSFEMADVAYLQGVIVGNRISMRVGSSPGHATEIDLDQGVLRYYDRDLYVCDAFKDSLEEKLGLDCKDMPGEAGIECSGVTSDKLGMLAKILPWVTSADIRAYDKCLVTCQEEDESIYDYCADKCREEGYGGEEESEESSEEFDECVDDCLRDACEESCSEGDLYGYAVEDLDEYLSKLKEIK